MGEGTVGTYLDGLPVLLHIGGVPRTGRQLVHRTVTEQTVKVRQALVARKVFAVFIFKKTIGILHKRYLFLFRFLV